MAVPSPVGDVNIVSLIITFVLNTLNRHSNKVYFLFLFSFLLFSDFELFSPTFMCELLS